MVCYNMLLQALLSHGVITHAQYMNFIYMKNVINNCKTEHEGSVIAEVGSEHCNSEGHMTDSDEAMETCEEKRKSEIQVPFFLTLVFLSSPSVF